MSEVKVYDRVTEIVSCFSGIDKIPENVLKKAAHRGEIIHKMIEGSLQNFVLPEISEEHSPFFDSFKSWYQKNEIDVDWMERRLYCDKLMITGKPDILTKDNRLIDIKTGSSLQKSWPVQLAGYKYLLEENGVTPSKYQVLFVQKGKEARLITYQIEDFTDTFLSCYKVYSYFYKGNKCR